MAPPGTPKSSIADRGGERLPDRHLVPVLLVVHRAGSDRRRRDRRALRRALERLDLVGRIEPPAPRGSIPQVNPVREGDISCGGSQSCEVVSTSAAGQPYADHWNGSAWSAQSIPTPEGGPWAELLAPAVSCPSTTACELVGGSSEPKAGKPMAPYMMRWNGTSWAQQTVALPARLRSGQLESVSCISPTSCLAAGGYEETNQESRRGLGEA